MKDEEFLKFAEVWAWVGSVGNSASNYARA